MLRKLHLIGSLTQQAIIIVSACWAVYALIRGPLTMNLTQTEQLWFFGSMGLGALVSLVALFVATRRRPRTMEDHIEDLTATLADAMESMNELQAEVDKRTRLAGDLQRQVQEHETLVRLKKEEVETVAIMLKGALSQSERRTFWTALAQNALFFILGAALSYFLR